MTLLGAVKRANAPHPPEDSVPLRVAVLVAVLAAAAGLLAQGVGGPALRVAALAGIPAGFAYSHLRRHHRGYLLKALLAAGVLAAFAGFLGGLGGVAPGAINELQVPLAELFLWVQVLHSLDVPARRDLRFSLLSSLILVAVAAVLSVTSALALYLAVWALAALAALVLAHRSEVGARPALRMLDPPDGAARRRRAAPVRPLVVVTVLAAVVTLAVFLVAPAAGSGRAVAFPARLPSALAVPDVGGLANPSLGGDDPASADGQASSTGGGASAGAYHGFATSLDTSVRGRPGRTLIMRVRAERPDFWRGQSFDTWDGRSWTQSDQRVRPVSGDMPIHVGGGEAGVPGGADFVQTVFLEQPGPNLIFAAYAPAEVYFTDRVLFEMSDGTIRTGVQMLEGSVYTVVSRRPPVTEELLRDSGSWGPPVPAPLHQRYTRLPAVPARVAELARRVTAGAPTTYDKVRALEGWMGDNTRYTLEIPPLPPGADAVEQYLFEDRRGFCEQIGSALVVMLRSLGIPARLAVGFAPGERNPFTGLWEVRAEDAHAWAEVWFPGLGWQAFDPTASVPLAGDRYSSAAAAGLFEFVRARLPAVPGGVARAAGVALLAGLPLATVAVLALGAAGRRRARARRPWPDRLLERMEAAGARRGRSRREWESARRYADVLARSVLPDPRLRQVAGMVEAEAFGGEPPSEGRRRAVEALLAEIEADHPVRL